MNGNSNLSLATVIMAAGKGTRMKSNLPKVLHTVGGVPMVLHVVRLARQMNSEKIIVITGYEHELVEKTLANEPVEFAYQAEQLGTGHAVAQAEQALSGFRGNVLVLSGDVPLLKLDTIRNLLKKHRESGAQATMLTTDIDNPDGYGRVIRDDAGRLLHFVEDKDATPEEKQVKEINSGIYVFESGILFKLLPKLQNKNAQGEYYLPDVFSMILSENGKVSIEKTKNNTEISGVNTLEHLKELNKNVSK